jgi:nitroreductase
MELYEAIRARHSARAFTERAVEEEKLTRIFEAARLAPSARNGQEWRFVVVRDPGTRAQLQAAAFEQTQVGQAPVVIAACGENDGRVMSCGQLAYPIDVAIAVDHLTLAATSEGLGTCWICRFDEMRVKTALGIPPENRIRVIALLPLGYPQAPAPATKPRLPIASIVRREHW